ncbi:single-stranded DNA-binding protein [[Clostridium] innocuum]|nr:single-stranded DNA-binding protein [[Clostridium] innocuum]MCR0257799.1 single-stranded DNA-binding protein [[Clostridium] innocuum]MCR0443052.1 single-stranded DNA-binding protein [[Clostridium] innocuum]MCR0456832.1 single-stranded DNA-binding protein [[Clostridium] innocuum]
MINRVVLAGRLVKDPVLRKTANGASVVSFTVACTRRFKQEGQPDADFINTVVWNKNADSVQQYTHKGSLVGVEGRIQTRSYDDQSGKRVYVTEVVADSVQFLESKSAAASNAYVPEQGSNQGYQEPYETSSTLDIASDGLPF